MPTALFRAPTILSPAILSAIFVGCGPSWYAVKDGEPDDSDPTDATTSDPTTSDPTTDTVDTSSDATSAGDLALVQDLIAGDASPSEILPQVAWSGGWPVRDGDLAWFVYVSSDGPWALAGDFGGWTPQLMEDGPGDLWWAAVEVGPDPAGLGYKFVGPGDAWIADPYARSYTYDLYGELSYVAPPAASPRLDRWPGLAVEGLAPRDLAVWVPPGAGPWPVLYAHDGQNLFDPGAIWGGWRLQDALLGVDPMLVVGIANTPDRMDEYTHVPDDIGTGGLIGGRGDEYAALVEDRVRPHIEAVYGSTGLDGLMGSSLGGLVSLHVAQRYPGRYDFAASLSGTLGWGRFGADNETIEERWLADLPVGTAVYVDSGGSPGENGCQDPDGDGFSEDDPDASDNFCETRQFADALADHGYTWEVDLWHWWEPDAPHSEMAWAARAALPLEHFLSLR